jgi:four helix bundle protein
MPDKKYDIEERLIDFSVDIIRFVENLPATKASNYLGGQLLRSGISPALNYAEARCAESKKDFIHKMKLCLKELRETFTCLKIIRRAKVDLKNQEAERLITECNELISIFVKSIDTATKANMKPKT